MTVLFPEVVITEKKTCFSYMMVLPSAKMLLPFPSYGMGRRQKLNEGLCDRDDVV